MKNFEELYQLLNADGINIDPIELAESLWLSQYISKTEINSSLDDNENNTEKESKQNKYNSKPLPIKTESPKNTSKVKQTKQAKGKDAPLHPVSDKNSKDSLPFRTPLIRRLYTDNDLIYAFRHFRQKIISLKQVKLDEEKIADYMAETDIFRPYYKKSYEKKFTIIFIIDISESMEVWNSLINEFVKDIKNYHIFKKVIVYYLDTTNDTPRLFKKKEKRNTINNKWYKNVEFNTLTFMFSDMISKSWSSGKLLNEINLWQKYLHFAIVQMLPQRLWNGTKLIDASIGKMSSKKQLINNKQLISRMEEILALEVENLPELAKIPLLSFDENSIDAYGKVIRSLPNNKIEGALFEKDDFQGEYIFSQIDNNIEPEQRLRNFYKYATTTSKELLELLAMVPLNLPIMKLIQQKLLPHSTQEHLSEILVSDIINKEQKIDGFYQFYKLENEKAGVREELIEKIGAKKSFQTIVQISKIIQKQSGVFDFLAYVVDPTLLKNNNKFNEIDREFARISVAVLNEMGEEYKELAERLKSGYVFEDNINGIKSKQVHKPLKSIRVIGVGDGGGKMINHMIKEDINTIDLIVANTDKQALDSSLAPYKIQLGMNATRGLGSGMVPEKGREAAIESFEDIKVMLEGSDIVFISAGLGGGTGTGAAPIIAKAAKEVGALAISIVTSPFKFKGHKRTKLAREGLDELKRESDSIIVIPNEKLLSIAEKNMGIKESFSMVDDILIQAVTAVSNIILSRGEDDINIEFNDVKTVISNHGLALMGIGYAVGTNAAYDAAKLAIESPLLSNISIDGAMGVLVHFDLHSDYPIMMIGEAMSIIEESADEDAAVLFGTTTNENMDIDEVRVTIVATGIEQLTEAEIENEVFKQLKDQGWDDNEIKLEYKIDNKYRADIVLVQKNKPVSLIEVKSSLNKKNIANAIEQVKLYTKELNVPISYITNGRKIYEYDIKNNKSKVIDTFPSPFKLRMNLPESLGNNVEVIPPERIGKTNLTPKILWVDDRPKNNTRERKMFEKEGIFFDIVLSTNEALNKIKDNNYFAIISDMGREEGDREGYVLLKELRDANNNIPFFIYAGSNLQKHKDMAWEKGAQGSTNDSAELFKMVMNIIEIDLALNPSLTFESFIVGDSNHFAYTTAKSVAKKPSKQYNPLFIYGGLGLGKEHLLQAIGNYNIELGKIVIYTTLEQFMNSFTSHLRTQTMDRFRDKFRECDLLLMEDIQFLSRKEQTQEEFCYIFDELHHHNKQIVITSDRPPNKIAGLSDKLKTRFEWGLMVDIQPPGLETKIAIIQKKCELDGISLNNEIVNYIATHMGDNIREIEGTIIKLNALSSMLNQEITLDFAQNAIKDQLKERRDNIRIDDIIKLISKELNIKPSDIKSKKRTKNVVNARRIAIYLARILTPNSMPQIALYFGMKDHTTISHAMKKINDRIDNDENFKIFIQELTNKIVSDNDYSQIKQEIKTWFFNNYKKSNAFPATFPIKFGKKDLQNFDAVKNTILSQFETQYDTDIIDKAINDIKTEYGDIAWEKKSVLRVETKINNNFMKYNDRLAHELNHTIHILTNKLRRLHDFLSTDFEMELDKSMKKNLLNQVDSTIEDINSLSSKMTIFYKKGSIEMPDNSIKNNLKRIQDHINILNEKINQDLNIIETPTTGYRISSILKDITQYNIQMKEFFDYLQKSSVGNNHKIDFSNDIKNINNYIESDNKYININQICLKCFKVLNDDFEFDLPLSLNIKLPEEILYAVFFEILSNAIEYSKPKSKKSISYKINNRFLEIYFDNIGLPILDEEQYAIFKKSYRVNTIQSKEKRRGYGCYYVKELARQSKWKGNFTFETINTIDEQSSQNRFTLKFPLRLVEGV